MIDASLKDEVVAATMRAIRLHQPGGLAGLALETISTPRPGAGEALVRVSAAAITRDELEWPSDRLPATPSYELSGAVAAVSADVRDFLPGDEVYALTPFDRDGVAAEYAVVPAALLAPKPRSIDHLAAAAVPLAALSAWQGLFDHGRLAPGERALITGAAGGVGHFAIQLARWRGAQVIGAAGHSGAEAMRALGAQETVDVTHDDFDDISPVDLVFDTAGGESALRSLRVLRPGGRFVSVAEEPAFGARVDASYFVVEPNRAQLIQLSTLLENGTVRPEIDSVFDLRDAAAAFARSLTRGKRGKVVIRVSDE